MTLTAASAWGKRRGHYAASLVRFEAEIFFEGSNTFVSEPFLDGRSSGSGGYPFAFFLHPLLEYGCQSLHGNFPVSVLGS